MRNWKIRDFVLIGLLAAVEAAVIYGVGMLTAVLAPIMHIFGPSITAFIMGTVALFIVKRVRRFGAMTLFQSLGVALFTLTGMGSVVCLICVVIVSLIADILITKTNFKTIRCWPRVSTCRVFLRRLLPNVVFLGAGDQPVGRDGAQ